ncbi:k31, partial [Silurus asotus]
ENVQKDLQKTPMGIHVINMEGEEVGYYEVIAIYVGGVIILNNIGFSAQACALMLGVVYALNLSDPKELQYYYEFMQKVYGGKLSPKVLGLKNKF